MSTPGASSKERLKKLKESFVSQLPDQVAVIRRNLETIARKTSPDNPLEELHRGIHSLKGASASFGFKALSQAAAEGEHSARAALKGEKATDRTWLRQMERHLDRLECEITDLDLSGEEEALPLEVSVQGELFRGHRNKIIYLCEDDPFQCVSLASQIECFGFQVEAFEELDAFQDAVQAKLPDAIVMDLVHPEGQTGGAEIVQELGDRFQCSIPAVFISSKSDLSSRLAAVRAGSSAYFVKPANLADLCATLHTLTTPEAQEPNRVLIVEDDPYLSEMYAAILQEAGMETRILNNPLEAFPLLFDFNPDLILMDMHMPGCSGLELAKAIRQIETFISIPIVFLSGETDVDLHFDARRAGGDEFLIKPIKPQHLISAVSARAERMKLLRSMMVKDAMTGLFNHTTIKEYLRTQMERARRNKEPLCFAMIDVDHFKRVNDRFGHPVGDQVLVALAGLLRRRLRKSDIIGRYGGEEFAVILPGCSLTEARAILDQLRKSFAALRFTVGKQFFSATISCGVAQLGSQNSLEQFCASADDALYAAKKAGRNRVRVES